MDTAAFMKEWREAEANPPPNEIREMGRFVLVAHAKLQDICPARYTWAIDIYKRTNNRLERRVASTYKFKTAQRALTRGSQWVSGHSTPSPDDESEATD
jgi:hypothetical protein